MTDNVRPNPGPVTVQTDLKQAARHALALEQCSIFVETDCGIHPAKAMTDAAAYLRSLQPAPQEAEPRRCAECTCEGGEMGCNWINPAPAPAVPVGEDFCPFCGKPKHRISPMGDWSPQGYGPNGVRYVCSGPYENPPSPCPGDAAFYGAGADEKALAAWRTRAQPAPAPAVPVEDDEALCDWIEARHAGAVAFAIDPDDFHHLITVTPPQMRDILAALRAQQPAPQEAAPALHDKLSSMVSDLSHTGELSMLYRCQIADAITALRAQPAPQVKALDLARLILTAEILPALTLKDFIDVPDAREAEELGVKLLTSGRYSGFSDIRVDEQEDALLAIVERAVTKALSALSGEAPR